LPASAKEKNKAEILNLRKTTVIKYCINYNVLEMKVMGAVAQSLSFQSWVWSRSRRNNQFIRL